MTSHQVRQAIWPDTLIDGSEMGRRIRDFGWDTTSLGSIEAWPQSLRGYVGMLVSSSVPSYIFWGPEHVALYNDAFKAIPGDKHPGILGLPSTVAWPEVESLASILERVRATNAAVTLIDEHFALARFGFLEEFFCTICYSPLRDESSAIAGVLSTLTETTLTHLGERRMETLRTLAARSAEVLTERESYAKIATALENSVDLSFALLYLRDGTSSVARLATCVGLEPGATMSPLEIALGDESTPWPIWPSIVSGTQSSVERLRERFERLPSGRWPEAAHTALVMPVTPSNGHETLGVLVVGTSPRLHLDDAYRKFIALATSQVANVIAGARAYEAERERADALVELDRAKTAFFSNVSHEFRTPLTLMLGPLRDVLAEESGLTPSARSKLSVATRNTVRLQKLVNTLLDFSRGESGYERARFAACDIGALTARLAEEFRPVMEAARLRYVVDVAPDCVALIDGEMWSTIVLNLLSNAFKFTLEGEVRVTLVPSEASLTFVVEDTGSGISASELPHIFERFHRAPETRSRSHEGSGIGLALVRELTRAHGGEILARSELGRGSSFTVTLPAGTAHLESSVLPAAEASPLAGSARAPAFVEEAMRWSVPAYANRVAASPGAADDSPDERDLPCVLLADDHADMREYIARLLEPHYRVVTVADGVAALDAARTESPDLVLTDVMMPRLDGFGLLRAIRNDPALRAIPVVMLSARAGEQSAIEGLDRGADDYVIKPFSAPELLARVRTTIALARLRRDYEREHRVADLFQRASLPLDLPNVPGLSFDAVYVPGKSDERVGGDWYDAVRLLDGRVVISIGDVAGSGVAAAVTMGCMRQIIRGIAQVHADPVLMLDAADRALRLEHPDLFVTAFVGVLDPITRTLTYASAGHPPPYLRTPDGRLEMLAHAGLPLGLRRGGPDTTTTTVHVRDGGLLVLYTDGLTEATHDSAEGERLVEFALAGDEIARHARPALALRHAVLAETTTDDDIAILTVSIDPDVASPSDATPPLLQRWNFAISDAVAAQRTRRTLGEELRTRGASAEDVYDAEMVLGELIGNIVRYAPGDVEIAVDWSGVLPVLHVLDCGPGFRHIALLPNDPYSESGRGLFLVATLTEDFNVRRRAGGGSHACAVLSLARNRLANVSRSDTSGLFLDAFLRTY